MTTSAPSSAASRPSPVTVLTPVSGAAASASWPSPRSNTMVFEPMRPVPPITTIFILPSARIRPLHSRYSPPDEGEQVGVHDVGMGGAHAVRKLLVDFQRSTPEQLDREQCRVGDRHDLVVVAMHHERRYVDDLQILGEVGLRERLDPVVVRLCAPHHALAPPILDDWL